MALLGHNALDVNVSEEDFCLILGYLCSPNRIGLIEAQIPEEKSFKFEAEFPNEPYFPITQGETSGGKVMNDNCPSVLLPFLGVGTGSYVKRINKGKFVEKIVKNYGFSFGNYQDVNAITAEVQRRHPNNIDKFYEGYNL